MQEATKWRKVPGVEAGRPGEARDVAGRHGATQNGTARGKVRRHKKAREGRRDNAQDAAGNAGCRGPAPRDSARRFTAGFAKGCWGRKPNKTWDNAGCRETVRGTAAAARRGARRHGANQRGKAQATNQGAGRCGKTRGNVGTRRRVARGGAERRGEAWGIAGRRGNPQSYVSAAGQHEITLGGARRKAAMKGGAPQGGASQRQRKRPRRGAWRRGSIGASIGARSIAGQQKAARDGAGRRRAAAERGAGRCGQGSDPRA